MMMIIAVPDKSMGSSLKARSRVIPNTDPGMIYGNMVSVSMISVSQLFLRVVRYATVMPRNTIMTMAAEL